MVHTLNMAVSRGLGSVRRRGLPFTVVGGLCPSVIHTKGLIAGGVQLFAW